MGGKSIKDWFNSIFRKKTLEQQQEIQKLNNKLVIIQSKLDTCEIDLKKNDEISSDLLSKKNKEISVLEKIIKRLNNSLKEKLASNSSEKDI